MLQDVLVNVTGETGDLLAELAGELGELGVLFQQQDDLCCLFRCEAHALVTGAGEVLTMLGIGLRVRFVAIGLAGLGQ